MNYLFARIIRKLGYLRKINYSVTRNINGKNIIIPVINGHGDDNLSLSELWMCSLIQKVLLLKKGTFIDVGVNIGQTLIKLRTVDETRDYIGFEPNPVCVFYSSELIKVNQYKNTKLIPVGLFSENAILELNLFSDAGSDSAASLIDNFRPNEKVYKKVFVPVCNFESLKEKLIINDIAIIKIDVEGAELEVLQSLENALQTFRPFIFIEILPCYNEENTFRINRQLQIEQLLKQQQYNIFRVIKENGSSVKQLQELDKIGIHSDLELCEYVMAPQEFRTQVTAFF